MNPGDDDDERLLQRFRQWLREARAEAEQSEVDDAATSGDAPMSPEAGLCRLVEEFTALRHEVKLQTRSSRGLDERIETLLESLRQATDSLNSVQPREAQAAWAAGKGLAATLAELDDALDRGRQQTEKAIALIAGHPSHRVPAMIRDFQKAQSPFTRWLHRGYHRHLLDLVEQTRKGTDLDVLFEALLDGYRLIQKRLTQAMAAEGVMRIDTLGLPVDPERMVVLEVIDTDEMPGGFVYAELRRGYTWNGRVLRYAEVRATRS